MDLVAGRDDGHGLSVVRSEEAGECLARLRMVRRQVGGMRHLRLRENVS